MTPRAERVELAPGLEISRLVTGLWQIADMERDGTTVDPERAAADVDRYVDAGLTTFDMADHYGSAELIAGHYRRTRPDRPVQCLTKWVPVPGPVTRADVRRAVERARSRLDVEAIDLLQFHAWRYSDPSWLDGLLYLAELQADGLIRHLGLTNVDAVHLDMIARTGVRVVSNQVCYSLLDRRPAGPMTEVCREHGIQLLVYGTLAGGLLTDRWLGRPDPSLDLETWSEMKYRRFVDAGGGWEALQTVLRALSGVAERRGVSMANVATRYVLEQPAVAGIIVGARLGRSAHVDENLRVFDFALDDESRQALDAATAALTPIPGDCGDEYRRPPFLTASGDLSHHVESFPSPYPVRTDARGRRRALSGTIWEDLAGFSRAVRRGDRILVSGTTATHGDRVVGGDDPAAQLHFVIDKVQGAVEALGGSLDDVVRTRLYVGDPADWEAVSRVHGQRFGSIQPANTLVHAGIIGDDYAVEMEAEAVVDPGGVDREPVPPPE